MSEAAPPGSNVSHNSYDAAEGNRVLDELVEMAWEPGWGPAALLRLVRHCDALRNGLDPAAWRAALAAMREHPLHRLMLEDPLIRAAGAHAGRPELNSLLLDLLLRHEAVAEHWQGTSRAGRDLFEATSNLGHFAGLRGQPGFLARVVEGVLERRPGAEILSLGAGRLREAAMVSQPEKIGRWVAQEPDAGLLGALKRELPPGIPLRSLRCNLGYFARKPYARGCFDLILLPELPGPGATPRLRELVDSAFAALKPGGLLLLGSPGLAPLETAWLEAFMGLSPCWRTPEEMQAVLSAVPAAEAVRPRVFGSIDGHRLYAMVERRH